MLRKLIRVEGIVQGVGFRPFIYRIACERGLVGQVFNDSQGVKIEVEGPSVKLEDFLTILTEELPPLASISRMEVAELPVAGGTGFRIVESSSEKERVAQIAPDSHVCKDCLAELFDPRDRRYRYPFINCTNCGPRYSIVTDIPYDRSLTTMADFPMCDACLQEYRNPLSRRFHAQPNACSECGPQLTFADSNGLQVEDQNPLSTAVSRLKKGEIVAIKGLGGYHLAADATNNTAVELLRRRKQRDEKPFALMSFNLEQVRQYALVSNREERLLLSVERPIVLLQQRADHRLSHNIAPGNRFFGVMLPYAPLHFLLLEEFSALVMTSGNQSDEPIAIENIEARERLQEIADCTLEHNRRIQTRCDDSIARLLAGEPVLYRRSRGYVPRGICLPKEQPVVLAVGAELKNTVCLTRGDQAYLSQHIGDLKNQSIVESMQQTINHLQGLLQVKPQLVAHDLHPDYASTNVAAELAEDLQLVAVQHHHAHLASCLVDNGLSGPAIGVIFDGIGYGNDGHIWGGEFLVGDLRQFERIAHLRYQPMPGGDAATREPWRMAFSYLQQVCSGQVPGLTVFSEIPENDLNLLQQMIEKKLNTPLTSSVGRLFDAVAALVGVRSRVSYEGQAALELEMLIEKEGAEEPAYPFAVIDSSCPLQLDPTPMFRSLVNDLNSGVSAGRISARFHNGLAQVSVDICRRIASRREPMPVALSGGVFQNRYLTELATEKLRQAGFEVLLHRQVPPNDGGLSLGQAAVAGCSIE